MIIALNKMLAYYSLLLLQPKVFGHIWTDSPNFGFCLNQVKNRKKVHRKKKLKDS